MLPIKSEENCKTFIELFDCVTQIIYESHKDMYVCTDIQKNNWYVFKNHRWIQGSTFTLFELIYEDMKKMLMAWINEKNININDKVFFQGEITCIIKTLMPWIINALIRKFHDPLFESKADSQWNLICFENGVYDSKEMCFRDGKPSDYCTKSTGYCWKNMKNCLDEEEMKNYFSQILLEVDKDYSKYLSTYLSTYIC